MPHEVQTGSEGPDLRSTSAVVFSLSSFSQPRAGRPEAREAAQGEHCCRRAALVWTFAARLHFVKYACNSIQPPAAVARVSRRRADALSWSAAVSRAPAGRQLEQLLRENSTADALRKRAPSLLVHTSSSMYRTASDHQ